MKLVETTLLPLSAIEPNRGQIDGLPKNPRALRDGKFDALKKSIADNPEMLALRELLVYQHGDKYVIIGGNMRYRALKDLKYKDAPCKVIPADTPVETLRAYTIKDNGDFGEWDFDLLANEWDDDPLEDWGVDGLFDKKDKSSTVKEDDFEPASDTVVRRCAKGDIWQLGKHRLMCGDSANDADVAKLMDGELADMVFTDPPYGVSIGDKNKTLSEFDRGGSRKGYN